MRRDQAKEEFEEFVTSSADDLLRTAYLVVWDLTAAEDLVQECLFRTARRWPRVRSMDHPKAYARRVLVNLALDGAGRRHRHRSELDLRDRPPVDDRHDEAAAGAIRMVETTSDLIDALGVLAPRQRAVLVLRYFEDLSESQVAEILGCSVGTVKSTTSRALDRLRHALLPAPRGTIHDHSYETTDTNGVNDDEPATRI
jgi:RNA polymerase sigma-70 factor (sigma-E family)